MAWTTPRTWVTGETVTAALLNAHIRDNQRETSPFTVTTAGDLSYADGANSMNSRVGIGAALSVLASTGSAPIWRTPTNAADSGAGTYMGTVYESLGGPGFLGFSDEIEASVTTGTGALILFRAGLANNASGGETYMSYSISGATTAAASDAHGIWYESGSANDRALFGGFDYRTGLTAGTNVFTLEGRVNTGTGRFVHPEIFVLPF
jgi:hypothetical protein